MYDYDRGRSGFVGSPSSLLPPRRGKPMRAVWRSPNFILGFCGGVALAWLLQQLALVVMEERLPPPVPRPIMPPKAGGYHAIIIPAGGQTPDGPPPHVLARLERARKIWEMSPKPKPFIITTAWGTPHKPCPHDAAGFERHEAEDNARYLLEHGVAAASLLEESVSLETVGNAYFARVLHTDVRSLTRLAIVNNRFHMPRTRAVFGHVFSLPPHEGDPAAAYELEWVEVDDRLPPDVLSARLEKEAAALPKFAPGGPWQRATPTLRALHDWVHMENSAYATARLKEERKPLDPALLKSY